MPVRSQKQWKWLGANRPDLLHKWQGEAPREFSDLPEKKKRIRRAALRQVAGRK